MSSAGSCGDLSRWRESVTQAVQWPRDGTERNHGHWLTMDSGTPVRMNGTTGQSQRLDEGHAHIHHVGVRRASDQQPTGLLEERVTIVVDEELGRVEVVLGGRLSDC